MPWAKLDDRFYLNPKVMRAGLEGRALYVAGLVHAAGGLTDGVIAQDVITRLAVLADVTDVAGATERLVSLNLWEETEGGYLIHDYLEYNPTRQHMQQVRQVRADAGRLGGRPLKHIASDEEKQTESKLLSHARVPSRPLPPKVSTATRAVVAPAEPDAEPAPPVARPVTPVPKPKEREKSWIERHPLFQPLVAIAEIGRPAGDRWSLYGKALKTLDELGATPEQVPRCAENYPLVMGTKADGTPIPLTLTGLVNNWNLCATGRKAHLNGGSDDTLQAARRRAEHQAEADAVSVRAILGDLMGPGGRVLPPPPKLDSS